MAFKILPEEPKPATFSAESLHRIPSQVAARAGAAVPGVVGDVLSLPYAGVNKLVSALGGGDVPYEQSYIGKAIPTTETHRKNLEEGIPYLKPRNEVERFVGDIAEDASSLFVSGSGLVKAGLKGSSLLGSLITSVGANAAGEAVKDLTGDEKKGAYTKMGTMFLLSALTKPGVQKEIGNLYQKADELLPPTATTSGKRLSTELNGLKEKILAGRQPGDLAASEKFVIDQSDTVLRQIQDGKINVNTLRSTLRSLNENLQKAVYDAPDKSTKVRARVLAKGINHSINNTLADYGKTNPEWWKYQKGANQAFAAAQGSNFVSNFIQNNIVGNPITHGLLHAFGVAGAVSPVLVPYQGAKIIYQIAKSPELAKHYARVVSSAASENAPLMNKEIKKLDERLKKEQEKKPRFKLVD